MVKQVGHIICRIERSVVSSHAANGGWSSRLRPGPMAPLDTGLSLSSGRPKAGPVSRYDKHRCDLSTSLAYPHRSGIMTDLAFVSPAELAAMIRNREISPVEVVRATVARVEPTRPMSMRS